MVFRVVGWNVWKCPVHGEFKLGVVENYEAPRKEGSHIHCFWQQYDGWGQKIPDTECGELSPWVRYETYE